MATGIPGKNPKNPNNHYCPVRLEYERKRSVTTILNTPVKAFQEIHQDASLNRLYYGENFDVLLSLIADSRVFGKVTLIYIDPPFSTQGAYLSRTQQKAYEDTMAGGQYIEFLRERLILLHMLLADCGSIYLHLDEKMVFEMKLIMDEIFGSSNYRNLIVRKKCNPKNYTRKAYGNIADFILFYTKTDNYVWNRPVEVLSSESAKEYHYTEPGTGRRYMKVPIHAPGIRNGATGSPWRGMLPPPGKHWQYTPKTLDEMDARGEIFWSKNENPRRKVYLDGHSGVGVQDIWMDFRDAHNQNIRITGYPTEKNPDLLRRIVGASSNPGDLVLDCFAGSGTTLAIANEMQRNWIGVDSSPEALKTILARFEIGLSPMGDYVKKSPASSRNRKAQQTLFESLEAEHTDVTRSLNIDHVPMRDFSIFVGAQSDNEVHATILDWQKRNTEYLLKHEHQRAVVSEPVNIADICYQLQTRDKALAGIIDSIGPCTVTPRHSDFEFLADAIISRQLSKNAADSITRRFRKLFSSFRITPKSFLSLTADEILQAGLSRRKYEYLADLAKTIESKRLRLSDLCGENDETIREALKSIRGIGDWTVDMFLLFGLARLDVLPTHDLALRTIISDVYGIRQDDTNRIEQIAEQWKPYRSVACWYLYRYGNMKAEQSAPADALSRST
ncbi:MAG: DNA methyltransferase, partial [Desulfomonile sp.]